MRSVFPLPLVVAALVSLVPSAAFSAQSTLYGLIQTTGFNELTTYDLHAPTTFGYDASSVIPLNFTNLLPQNSITSIAVQGQSMYGLVRTAGFNELITFDLNKSGIFGYDATSIIPLNFSNILPQNSIGSISVQGDTLYGLITTPSFNELITFDLNNTGSFGYDATSIIPLNFTNLLPQNSLQSIYVQGSTLYALVKTSSFNELMTFDLDQNGTFGYDATSIIPLNFSNLLPQNSLESISVQGNTLYALERTSRFNELMTFDLDQRSEFGYDATSIIPLDISNLLPQNSIVAIAVVNEPVTPVPEPSSAVLVICGIALTGLFRRFVFKRHSVLRERTSARFDL